MFWKTNLLFISHFSFRFFFFNTRGIPGINLIIFVVILFYLWYVSFFQETRKIKYTFLHPVVYLYRIIKRTKLLRLYIFRWHQLKQFSREKFLGLVWARFFNFILKTKIVYVKIMIYVSSHTGPSDMISKLIL